jgi:hypothetical protein
MCRVRHRTSREKRTTLTNIANGGLVTGDFDRNGRLDVAVLVGTTTSTLRILLGNGAGGFSVGSPFGAGNNLKSASVADINGDGILDLCVAANLGAAVNVLYGNGTGGFTWTQTYALSGRATTVLTADFDGDGRVDVAGGAEDRSVTLLRARR